MDSAGGIPLAFGKGAEQLLERCADETAREPPLISRNDAARLVVEVSAQTTSIRVPCGTTGVPWVPIGTSAPVPAIDPRSSGVRAQQVISRGLTQLSNVTVDAAWEAKWGMSSAGTEEAARRASRQDVVAAAAAV